MTVKNLDKSVWPQPDEHWSKFWLLEPETTFLNHGSYGACPLPVLEVQQELRQQLERQPLRFFNHEWEPLIDAARVQLAEFVGADPAELVFVPNATTGVNAVLRSLQFQPGDELLTTNHAYNACRNALNFVAERSGAKVVVAKIPFPIVSEEEAIAAITARLSTQTRLLLLDHVTSQTGLILPISEIIHQCRAAGIEVLVDGAHAPGMLPLDLQTLGATYYTGNCHKWMCAPKGSAFLYVKQDKQPQIRPLTISHGANSPRRDRSRFHLEFDWMGSDDPTAYLSVPAAIQFMGSCLPGGWLALMSHNHQLAIAARQVLCKALGVDLPSPEAMIGSLAVVPLPDGSDAQLQTALMQQFGIEVPIIPWPAAPHRVIRISAQIYNALNQYQYLAAALGTLLP
jgi:isopenicillin-N epimerase